MPDKNEEYDNHCVFVLFIDKIVCFVLSFFLWRIFVIIFLWYDTKVNYILFTKHCCCTLCIFKVDKSNYIYSSKAVISTTAGNRKLE